MERLVDPLTTTDAKLWADEFMKVKARLGEQKFDHAMMLGWFANAIMQGYDEGRRRAKADAQATVEALQRERDFFETAAATANRMRVDTERALDAEREKAKNDATAYRKLSEQWNATDLELSQLQALVRAFFTSEDKWAAAYRELERLGYTLDTTTPAEKMKEPQNENDDRQS